MEHRGQEHAVGRCERRSEVGGELTSSRAEAARLEQGDQPAAGEALPERRQRSRDLRGMVGEVVDHDDSRRLADDLEPALDAPEGGERLQDGLPLQPVGAGRRPHRHRIQRVVLAPDAEFDPLAVAGLFQFEGDSVFAALRRDRTNRTSPAPAP